MDDLLSEFLTETTESLDVIAVELVRFESRPDDKATLNIIFRLVHTIKGVWFHRSAAAGPEIAGVLNLRGRILTAIDARSRLGRPTSRKSRGLQHLAIGVARNGESLGLIIDEIGEVVRLNENEREQNPVNLDATWSGVSRGVYRLEDRLLVIMDIDRMLAGLGAEDAAAAA